MNELELTASQLKCLASPTCNDVLQALRALGEASAAEVARRVHRSPATIHYHLKCLVECGLVREAYRRPDAPAAAVAAALAPAAPWRLGPACRAFWRAAPWARGGDAAGRPAFRR